ncbi:hypothetical protein B0X71_05205 [Planococcus lenghuensis]|uniref:DUF3267 domain-containing protein n=2 Tax=Planococcus lenghuensis TaxID=2213202 RepID=A0A1Q2KY16_9BACL|nr:hypothetical protein B0X71_05205 [Planococcus lenghuensis]
MHCWKTINMKKKYGRERIFLLSALAGLGVFVTFYIPMAALYSAPLSDQHFLYFLIALAALYPLHKLLHFLPLMGCRNCVQIRIRKHFGILPEVEFRVQDPVNKVRFLITLLTPFVVLNTVLLVASFIYPAFSHYWALLLGFHCGLCMIDLMYFRYALRSPKHALIEETDTGYEILVPSVTL